MPAVGALAALIPVALVVACGSSSDAPLTQILADAGDAAPLVDASDGSFPILPYPPGPYGGGIGDVLPDFTIQGYALSRTQRDSRKLPWRDIHLAEVRSQPGCTCLVITITTAGSQCGPCVLEDQSLTATLDQDPSICALEAITINYDGAVEPDASVRPGPQWPTRADLDVFTQANRESYPVGIVTTSSAHALSTLTGPLIPENFIVRTSDMRVMGMIDGSAGGVANNIRAACDVASPPVETLASGIAPRRLVVDATSVYFTDAQAGVLAVPLGGGAAPIVLAKPASSPDAIAIDADTVYFASHDGGTSFVLGQVPKAGGAPTVLDSGPSGYQDVATDGTNVYFARDDGVVGSVPKGGGAVTVIASGEAGPTSIVVDDANVYWLASTSSEIARAPKGGGARVVLVPAGSVELGGQHLPILAIRAYGSNLLVDAGTPAGGLFFQVPTAGGTAAFLGGMIPTAMSFAVTDAGGIVSASGDPRFGPGNIGYMPRPGGQLQVVTSGQSNLRDLVVDAKYVYWTIGSDDFTSGGGSIRRIELPKLSGVTR